MLVRDGHVTGLLDWEEADLDWLVWDLASSILPFCSTAGGDLDTSATQGFLDTYRAASGRVQPEEDDLIVPLLRVKRILEVLRAPPIGTLAGIISSRICAPTNSLVKRRDEVPGWACIPIS